MASAADELRGALDGLPVRVVDVGDVWPSLRIGRTVPLGRLEWLWTLRGASVRDSSTSARAVFNVSRSLALSEPAAPRLAHEWFRRAYLHILLVTIAELQVSRESPGWSRVRSFVDASRELHHEYLVVCVADDVDVRTHKKVLEKLRAEVNLTTRGRERVVTVPVAPPKEDLKPISHLHHSPSHQDLLVRLRECARDGVEARVQSYEAEAGRSFANRSSPSWSFTSYFVLKEGMSFVFVQIGRRDLALKCYDELAAVMGERDERGPRGFCNQSVSQGPTGSVVDPYAKDFRRMAIDGEITELDLRSYLFARQASVLLIDRKYSEVAERGLKFITVVARRAAEEAAADEPTIGPVFRDAWVFRAARSLAAALAPAIPAPPANQASSSKQLGTARERHTARLIAGFHVHAIKAFSGLAQLALPGTLVASDGADGDIEPVSQQVKDELAKISHDLLRNALSEPSKAVDLYSEMANAAASLYEMGGRARGAAALDGDAGVVRLRNDSLPEAEELLSAQCSRFTEDHGWDQLHRRRRVELANAEKSLNRVQEYLVSCLTMLFMTRERRRLGLLRDASEQDLQFHKNEAARWAAEARVAAGQLPRVMKYKAEKLLRLFVRANAEPWKEGDAGSATVAVQSDIPANLQIDSVYVEMRWVSPPTAESSARKAMPPALHRPENGVGKGDDLTSPVPSGAGSAGAELQEVLTLSCNESFLVGPGVTLVTVTTPEVPRSGRYTVSVVALVVGRLKLVQAALKAPTIPTVSTKGTSSAKVPSAALAASAAQSDLPNSGKSRFPCFFSKPRPEAASVAVDGSPQLYFLPSVVQQVCLTVTAGPYGLAGGSSISVSLAPWSDAHSSSRTCVGFVEDGEVSLRASSPSSKVLDALATLSLSAENSADIFISSALAAGEAYHVQIPVQVRRDPSTSCSCRGDVNIEGHTCVFHALLVCTELTSERRMSLKFRAEQKLRFTPVLRVTARIELSAAGDEITGASAATADGEMETPLFGGGLLLCSLRSQAGARKSLKIVRVSLELPPWLVLVSSSAAAHDTLLPCTLRRNGLFTVGFDISVCTQPADRLGARHSRASVRAKDRMLSRLPDALDLEGAELRDGAMPSVDDQARPYRNLAEEGSKPSRSTLDPGESVSDLEYVTASRDRGGQTGTLGSVSHINVSGVSLEQLDVDDAVRDASDARGGSNIVGHVERNGLGDGTASQDDLQGSRLRDSSAEVVDLSDSSTSYRDAHIPSSRQACGGSDAVLLLQVEVEGLSGTSSLELPISMSGLRPQRRRYRVDANCQSVATVGDPIVLRFQINPVTAMGMAEEETPGPSVLHYQVDADPKEWLIAGRRRGQFVVSDGEGDTGEVMLVPLCSGRLYMPSVQLFARDGAPLSPSQYDNVNKGGQVTVLPPGRVLSSCSSEPIPLSALENMSRIGKRRFAQHRLPPITTVTGDRFFGQ